MLRLLRNTRYIKCGWRSSRRSISGRGRKGGRRGILLGALGGWLSVVSFFPPVFLPNLRICEHHFNVLILSPLFRFPFCGKVPPRGLFSPTTMVFDSYRT
ncbi:hypothetical protein B9Z19DRAFT_1039963 [Tuber borchii]|uniref:Uncharacterized protein n=1 Tax=Tuber borchii TaxID=42251 RepID=A0A2T7A5N9_TUBBO|nr:hypothetical protein B9Z19DRAFT_1039963 [Tuber borchii]